MEPVLLERRDPLSKTHPNPDKLLNWVPRPHERCAGNGRVKKPINSFMCYRMVYREIAAKVCRTKDNRILSKYIGESWAKESDQIRGQYRQLADTNSAFTALASSLSVEQDFSHNTMNHVSQLEDLEGLGEGPFMTTFNTTETTRFHVEDFSSEDTYSHNTMNHGFQPALGEGSSMPTLEFDIGNTTETTRFQLALGDYIEQPFHVWSCGQHQISS